MNSRPMIKVADTSLETAAIENAKISSGTAATATSHSIESLDELNETITQFTSGSGKKQSKMLTENNKNNKNERTASITSTNTTNINKNVEQSDNSDKLQSKKKVNRGSNSRILPLNTRIRSVFEILRNRFNPEYTTTTNTTRNKKSDTSNTTTSIHSTTNKRLKGSSTSALKRTSFFSNSNEKIFNSKKAYDEDSSNSENFVNVVKSRHNNQRDGSSETDNICQLCCNQCDEKNYMYDLDTCEHSFCIDCLRQYLKYQIIESRVSISCPQCVEKMHPNDIYRLLSLTTQIKTQPIIYESISTPVSPVSPKSTNSLLNNNKSSKQHSESSSSSTCSNKSSIDSSIILKSSNNESHQNWPQLIQKYEEFMLRRVLVTIQDTRWCPAPDCTYAVIASGCANCPQLYCMRPNCNTSFCYHCKQYWHPNLTCEDAATRNNQSNIGMTLLNQDLSGIGSSASTNKMIRSILQRSNSHLSTTSSNIAINMTSSNVAGATILTSRSNNGDMLKEEIKRCPKCQALIVKMDDGSCNHITCSVCGCEFCWLCMKEISDLHYLSPSGCTFWGKKPWSRKKKILWQLGTLIGAPVGIALIAGVAVPAILIGLPIWSGRKVYVRYKSIGKHKRNLIVVGTVMGTIIVAPLVAALAVVIGVPILLAYVYGVVPISLCRSGGCGVTTNGGVRLAFDEESDQNNTYFTGVATNTNNSNNINLTSEIKMNETTPSIKTYKSKSKHSKTYKSKVNSAVTIPISAIEPRPESITVSAIDNKLDPISTKNGSFNSPEISTNIDNSQTPILVTITMANKNNCVKSSTSLKKSKNNITTTNTRNRSSSSSSINHRKKSKSKNKNHNEDLNKINKNKLNANNNASVICGSMEIPSSNKKTSTQIKTITGSSNFKNTKNLNNNLDDETGTAINLTMRQLNDTKMITNEEENSVSNTKIKKFMTVTSLTSKTASNNKKNPSIGEISIGAFTASFSASGSNLYADVNSMHNNGQHYDEENDEEEDENSEDAMLKNKSNKTNNASFTSEYENNTKIINENDRDRESASNRGIASGSINSNFMNKNTNETLSIGTNSNFIPTISDANAHSKNEVKIDLKSTYTLNSCNEKPVLTNINDNDTYSLSMLSEKSINPSVTALAGSIK